MIERFRRDTQAVRGGAAINPNAGAGEDVLSRTLAAFAQQQAGVAAQQGITEAEQAGLEAGLQGTGEESSNITAAGRAFNQAAQVGHLATVRADIKTALGEQIINATNTLPAEQWVEAFESTSNGLRDGIIEETDPAIRGEALAYFNDLSSNHRLKLLESQQGELKKQTATELELGRADLLDDITTAARELDVQTLTLRQKEFEHVVNQSIDAAIISEVDGVAMIQDMHSAALQSEVLGAFEIVLEADLEEAETNLAKFKREKASELGLSVAEKDQLETNMTALFNREHSAQAKAAARNKAGQQAAVIGLSRETNDTIRMLESGFPASNVEDLARKLAETENFEKLHELQSALRLQDQLAQVQALPIVEQTELIQTLRAGLSEGKGGPDDLALLKGAEQIANRTETMLNKDPRGFAREQGIIETDEQLDTSSIVALADSIKSRVESGAAASQHYGRKVPAVTEAEANQLGAFWESADNAGKLAMNQALVDGLGPDAGDILQMVDKKGYKIAAYTGGLQTEGQTATAAAVLRGQDAIVASKDLMPAGPEKALLDSHISEELAQSFQHLPEFRSTTLTAINAYYADRAMAEGDFTGEFNRRRADQAIVAVVGNIVEDNTGATVPLRDIDQSEFDRWLDSIDAETVAQAGGLPGFEPDAAADLVRRSRVIAVGPGEFRFTQPSPFGGSPQFLFNEAGEPFTLTIDPLAIPDNETALDFDGLP